MLHLRSILQFIAIKRRDTGEWALPGGMVDPGEKVAATAIREFQEEAMNAFEATEGYYLKYLMTWQKIISHTLFTLRKVLLRFKALCYCSLLTCFTDEKAQWKQRFQQFFSNGTEIYSGYVDDPRNTDNAWMETVAYNFHDESGSTVEALKLRAGDDAVGVRWVDITSDLNLYASHEDIVNAVLKLHTTK